MVQKRWLMLVGLVKIGLGAAVLFTAGVLLATGLLDRTAGLSLLAIGGAVALAGHTICAAESRRPCDDAGGRPDPTTYHAPDPDPPRIPSDFP